MTESAPQQRKNVLVVSAHPESRSLTASLTSFAVERLRMAGHEVQVSDLYAMKWKATVDADDFPDRPADRRLELLAAHEEATLSAGLHADIGAEQRKLLQADAVVLQFPLWWFSVPAILKGWFDRVFTFGFAHGPGLPPPYSEGALAGRRALLSVTAGASEPSLSEFGIHGRLSDLLHPVQHGVFWFAGIAPLEPFAVYDANSMTAERYAEAERAYGRRLDGLFTDEPIPYRTLTGGDYGHDMRLLPEAAGSGSSGADLHIRPRT